MRAHIRWWLVPAWSLLVALFFLALHGFQWVE
jgi:hypothetical protein